MNRYSIILIVAMLLGGCAPKSRSNSTSTHPSLITKFGTFVSPGGTYNLVIGWESKPIVDYKIVHLSTHREFAPQNKFSAAHRWAAFWESDEVLWVYSGDIGVSVWKADSRGVFSHVPLLPDSPLISEIPQEIWEFLPSFTRRAWEPLRQSDGKKKVDSNP